MKDVDSLKNKTINSMIWSFMDTIGSRVIQLLIQIFLVRLLTPADFGTIGIVTMFIVISEVFVEGGFYNGLLRDKESSQKDYSTVFFFNISVALSIYLLLFAFAGYISLFFESPQMTPILRVSGLVILFDAIGMMQKVLLTKKLRFSTQMKINIASSIISGGIAIILALTGFGIWSLVIKVLLLQFLQAVMNLYANRWVPSFVFSWTSFKRLFDFGGKQLLSKLVTVLYENLYALIIGRGISLTSLGFYTNAQKLSTTASYSIELSVEKVSYPLLSKLQDGGDRLKSAFRKIFKSTVYITFPVMLVLASIAPALFRLVLGESWIPAIPYFQLLCIAGIFNPLRSLNVTILQIKGQSHLFLKLKMIEKSMGFLIVFTVLFFDLGVFGLLGGLVLDYFIAYFINATYTKTLINYSLVDQLKDIHSIFIVSFLTTAVVYSLNYINLTNDLILILSQIVISLSLYIALSYIFKLEELESFYKIAKPIQQKMLSKKTV